MIEIKVEPFPDVVYELMSLFSYHYAETEDIDTTFSPNIPLYNKLYQEQALFVVVARDAGVPVGYYLTTVSTGLHSKDKKQASEEAFYVDSRYRRQGVATALFSSMEKECKKRGVSHIYTIIKSGSPSTLLEGLGYKEEEVTYVKRIK
jgi:GNAT superfamily N-acetyltransferase